jgi:hypothetical protein
MLLRTGTIVVLWLLLSIPSAGLLASALDYPSVWGNHGGVLSDFVLPFPDLLGLLHLPTLIALALLLIRQPMWSRTSRLLFRVSMLALAISALLVILQSGLVPQSANAPSPSAIFMLFLLSDATVALVVSLLVPGLDLDRREAVNGDEAERATAWPYVTGLGIVAVSALLLFQFHIIHLPF